MDLFGLIRALLVRFEGVRTHAYLCPAHVWTNGLGHTRGVRPGDVITREQAFALADQDSLDALVWAIKLSPRLAAAGDQRLAAIADFIFNLGPTAYRASTLRKKVDAGDWPAAQRELKKWIWGGGRKLPGLVRRRDAEAQLVRQGA